MSKTEIASHPQAGRLLPRLLSCIRYDEVLVLQGAPLIGAIFSINALTMASIFKASILTVGSLCLVAHVFVFNDWSGIRGDLKDPNRAMRTFARKGVSRTETGFLAIALMVLSLLLLGLLGLATFVLALAIVSLSALYSAPAFHMKGLPVFNSVLHLVGGTLHFLLGYATFAAVDGRGIAIGGFFALVFTAGHLTHEVRGCEGDLLNGIQTNAVVFGKAQSFVMGLILFTAAYALLVTLAACGYVPRVLVFVAALYPVHLYASLQAMRAGLSFESLLQLQKCYRLLYAIIGVVMVVAVLLASPFSI
jgi:4-hydroxybenzoate polyprenyltransferase